MQDNLTQVKGLLATAPRPELILAVLPELLDPKQAISVVVTLKKQVKQSSDWRIAPQTLKPVGQNC